jgi:hypothetical protein
VVGERRWEWEGRVAGVRVLVVGPSGSTQGRAPGVAGGRSWLQVDGRGRPFASFSVLRPGYLDVIKSARTKLCYIVV